MPLYRKRKLASQDHCRKFRKTCMLHRDSRLLLPKSAIRSATANPTLHKVPTRSIRPSSKSSENQTYVFSRVQLTLILQRLHSKSATQARILFVSHYTELLGANRSLLALCDQMQSQGFDLAVALPSEGPMTEALHAIGVTNHVGRSTGVATAEIIDAETGKLYATGSTTCIVMKM